MPVEGEESPGGEAKEEPSNNYLMYSLARTLDAPFATYRDLPDFAIECDDTTRDWKPAPGAAPAAGAAPT